MESDLQVFARGTLAAVMRSLRQSAARYDSNQYRAGYMDALRDVGVAFELDDPIEEKTVVYDGHSFNLKGTNA